MYISTILVSPSTDKSALFLKQTNIGEYNIESMAFWCACQSSFIDIHTDDDDDDDFWGNFWFL